MPLAIPNRVRFATPTTGTGSVSVGAAVTGFVTPGTAGVPSGSQVGYGIEDGASWEVGQGTFQPGLISRDFVESSSASGAKLSLSGSAQVFLLTTGGMLAPLYDSRGRNKLINSLFRIWQRGLAAVTTNGAFSADRWQLFVVSDTVSVSQAVLTDAQRTTIADEEAETGIQINVTGNSAAGALTAVSQKIENLRRLAGKQVTLSFYATAPTNMRLGASIDQVFGTGGSPSTGVQGAGQSVVLGTAFQRYALTFTVPSVIGKVLGTNSDHYTQINLWASSGSGAQTRSGSVNVQTGVATIWGVQLETGAVATPMEKPGYVLDLESAMRYYQTAQLSLSSYQVTGSTIAIGNLQPVLMRAAPTLAVVSNASTGLSAAPTLSSNGLIFFATGTASATGSATLNVNFTASAEL